MSARPSAPVVRLPAGRRGSSGLTTTEVAANQRRRILDAMAQTVVEKGFPAATVADVIAVAGVSRATFYQQFDDLIGCFLAAFDTASHRVMAALGAAPTSDFTSLLAAYLDVLCEDPASAKVFLVDIFAAGPEGIRRRAASQQRFVAVIAELTGASTAADRFACEAFVAAVGSMVTTRIAAADMAGLRALREPLAALADRILDHS
jgi:AcrR family transcriptional regulator